MLNKKLNMTVNAFYVSRFSEQNDPCQTGRSLIWKEAPVKLIRDRLPQEKCGDRLSIQQILGTE